MNDAKEGKVLPLGTRRENIQDIFRAKLGEEAGSKAGTERPAFRPSLSFIGVHEIAASHFQTRENFDDEELSNLANSIRANGVLQPIIVRSLPADTAHPYRFELIAGERRLRAAKLAGLETLPAIVQDVEDKNAVEIAIIENAQRENLNPIEEALAYQILAQQFGLTQGEIAHVIGKNRVSVTNTLRLLQLGPRVIDILRQGALSAGHGRALLTIADQRMQFRLAKIALKRNLPVRALEAICGRINEQLKEGKKLKKAKENELDKKAILKQKEKISTALGVGKVDLKMNEKGERRLSLVFESDSSWRKFLSRIR